MTGRTKREGPVSGVARISTSSRGSIGWRGTADALGSSGTPGRRFVGRISGGRDAGFSASVTPAESAAATGTVRLEGRTAGRWSLGRLASSGWKEWAAPAAAAAAARRFRSSSTDLDRLCGSADLEGLASVLSGCEGTDAGAGVRSSGRALAETVEGSFRWASQPGHNTSCPAFSSSRMRGAEQEGQGRETDDIGGRGVGESARPRGARE